MGLVWPVADRPVVGRFLSPLGYEWSAGCGGLPARGRASRSAPGGAPACSATQGDPDRSTAPEGRSRLASQWCPPPASLCLPCASFCRALKLFLLLLRFFLPAAAGCPSSAASRSPSSMALLKSIAHVDGPRRSRRSSPRRWRACPLPAACWCCALSVPARTHTQRESTGEKTRLVA